MAWHVSSSRVNELRGNKAEAAMAFTAKPQKSYVSFPHSLLVTGQSYSVWEGVNARERGLLGAT